MIDFSTLNARDYAFLAAVLVAVYVVFSMLRLLRLGMNRRKSEALVRSEEPHDRNPASVAGAETYRETQWAAHAESSPARVVAEERPHPDFARELAHSSLELEVQHLRREAEKLRAEMSCLAEEVRHLKASRNVSPVYGEAMTLAQQGEPPAGIAAQCGISVGEAELVAALARSEPGFDLHEKENDPNDRYTDSGGNLRERHHGN
jgi:hypothetical protein